MKEYNYKYRDLEPDCIPRNGYVIIGKTLFQIEDNEVFYSWDLEGNSINELIRDARKKSGMGGATPIWIDTDNLLDEEEVLDSGSLIHNDEFDEMDPEERAGWIDFAEHYMDC